VASHRHIRPRLLEALNRNAFGFFVELALALGFLLAVLRFPD
jgi:hypothetical protein